MGKIFNYSSNFRPLIFIYFHFLLFSVIFILRLTDLLFDMQQYGQPPAEIMKDLAPGLKFDEEGMPIMPNMGGPGMPSTSLYSTKHSLILIAIYLYNLFIIFHFIFRILDSVFVHPSVIFTFLIIEFLLFLHYLCVCVFVYFNESSDGEGMPDMGNLSNLMATGQCSIS